ncbi:MAG: PHP-associated domain-containing protein, partial [Chloroflexota bacterium]
MSAVGRADLQLHSDLGDGLAPPAAILDAAERVGLDVIALTDHDDIRGSFLMRDLAARRSSRVQVVPGIEVTTRSGHLLALWIEDEVPMFGSLAATVARIHEMGGLAIVPHPLSYLTFSIGEGALRALRAGRAECQVDGIELRNPSYAGRVRGRRAAWLNEHVLGLAETGSSDAHHAELVGTAWTDFPGKT